MGSLTLLKQEVLPSGKLFAGTIVSPEAVWLPEAEFLAMAGTLALTEDLNPSDAFAPKEPLVGTEAKAAARLVSWVGCLVGAVGCSKAETLGVAFSFFSFLSFSSGAALAFREISACVFLRNI